MLKQSRQNYHDGDDDKHNNVIFFGNRSSVVDCRTRKKVAFLRNKNIPVFQQMANLSAETGKRRRDQNWECGMNPSIESWN